MKLKIKYLMFVLLLGTIKSSSCKKYLNEKPVKSAVVPSTMEDLEALLNGRWIVESSSSVNEILADDYYVDLADLEYLISRSANTPSLLGEALCYYWDKNATHNSWNNIYRNPVYYSNVVLDIATSIETTDQVRLDKIKGTALFYRAFAFERLVQVYCKPYSSSSESDLGLVLKLTSDINEPTKRATVKETYDQIINDLKEAVKLLPHTSEFPTQPTKAAAYGTLARTYLSMRDYINAGYYADLCLQVNSSLMDYNVIDSKVNPVFKEYNEEVIFHSRPVSPSILAVGRQRINPELYEEYAPNDLRRDLFFSPNIGESDGSYRFRGAYFGKFSSTGHVISDGITTGEMFLVRAESYARVGNKDAALKDLNELLINRMVDDGKWNPLAAGNANESLQLILKERRKELVMRGLRWTDLRRLNEEGANITLIRVLDGVTYTLPPGDLRWTLLIPEEVIERSTIEQNQR